MTESGLEVFELPEGFYWYADPANQKRVFTVEDTSGNRTHITYLCKKVTLCLRTEWSEGKDDIVNYNEQILKQQVKLMKEKIKEISNPEEPHSPNT